VIGGWKVTSLGTLAAGFPLTVSAGEDTANVGNRCRPNRDFSVSTQRDHPTIEKWFNTTAYSRAPIGTAGRSEVIGPGIGEIPMRGRISLPGTSTALASLDAVKHGTASRPLTASLIRS
jgi:hypothetical protein